jgi:hypothetical protein
VFKHIADEEAQSSANRSLGNNMREVHDGALDVWKGDGDGSRRCATATADIDDRREAVEDGRALAKHDVHDKAGMSMES